MKIAFLDPAPIRYTPETPFSEPLGGTQSAVCYLSMALARRGHDVTLITRSGTGERIAGVTCQADDPHDLAGQLNAHDVVIVVTSAIGANLRQAGVTTRLVNWQHKTAENQAISRFSEETERKSWSSSVFVSDFQKNSFQTKWGMDGIVLRNAISPAIEAKVPAKISFAKRHEDPVLVYASAPGRGLDVLLIAFPTIRKAFPNSKLKVFSDQIMYQILAEKDQYSAYYELARQLPGVEYLGGVSQSELAEQLMDCDIWAYPTIFIETSCIIMMEAAAAGCHILTSNMGALKETAGQFGRVLSTGNSRAGWSGLYAQELISDVERFRRDPEAHQENMDRQMSWFRQNCTWDRRAEEWESWLNGDCMTSS
jgi:glycosyltransferase involved in cell wall biosynthesis